MLLNQKPSDNIGHVTCCMCVFIISLFCVCACTLQLQCYNLHILEFLLEVYSKILLLYSLKGLYRTLGLSTLCF